MEAQNTVTNPVKAIRSKCLDCCCGSSKEVKLCTSKNCVLYPFRLGVNPYRNKRVFTEEQRQEMLQRFSKAKASI